MQTWVHRTSIRCQSYERAVALLAAIDTNSFCDVTIGRPVEPELLVASIAP